MVHLTVIIILFGLSLVNVMTAWDFKLVEIEIGRLNDNELTSLTDRHQADRDFFNQTLRSILVPRVPGSVGHAKVQQFLNQTMNSLGWSVTEDRFHGQTPLGIRPFANIIATHNPNACKRLTLACHYDSKMLPEGQFVGAIDSAVPCAMIISLAKKLEPMLNKLKQKTNDTTLQLIFFDGEEAFVEWTEKDSLYGSRHLAELWWKKSFPGNNQDKARCGRFADLNSELDRIQLLFLLDLIGSANPRFYSFFPNTKELFLRLTENEKRLHQLNRLETRRSHFTSRSALGLVADDHLPFLHRGVPILHLIPRPFPRVWHQLNDDEEHLHHPTISSLFNIILSFVVEYFKLKID